ncbi:Uncharacterized conserved protein [Flavobacterium glycines]|uniref:Uncharacterized conserved protein n=1 Tax=Flavobacterium glycines TaxID=551990 RepID=A0A1B9DJD7_9FLAO|nr:DUF2290 domain-containing protein [Flavobacterium glycines]OCB69824.1 hypothetical protein FBGL_12995 [Flavobacterium glycines]GEL12064.1 hypothetical protein FGL01_28030 [Flavobacterium glycines]SDJ90260.1 Uncharacterized conserved protein [Flavobacterium glycines]
MISQGKFSTELNEIQNFLNELDLLDERNYSPADIENVSLFRHTNFKENWKLIMENNIYDFLLKDNSLLIFKFNSQNNTASYTYIDCPYKCLSYNDFIAQEGFEDDFSKTFVEEYYLYVSECKLKENAVYIRYDVDSKGYTNGLHPLSHMHIGFNNDIRIGIDKFLTPKSFILFLLRQHYVGYWKNILKSDPKNTILTYYENHKSHLPSVPRKFFSNYDLHELYLQ